MKKISAAFDGLKFSEGTLAYALKLAANSKARLSGVFLDPFYYHSYGLYDLVGTQGISRTKLEHRGAKDTAARQQASARFEQACREAGISFSVHHDDDFAMPELLRESIYSDLLIIGNEENLSHHSEAPPTNFLRGFLSDTQCPVLVVPGEYREIEKVILLYDGKPSSVFAIKMFNYMLPWLRDKETEVLSVTDPKDEKELPAADLMKEFIQCHYPRATYTLLKGDAQEEILGYLKASCANALVVLGAYQRSAVSRWFKTSMADVLLKDTRSLLFIAHQK